MDYFVHKSSCIDEDVIIGPGTKIWHFSHVISGSKIGKGCNIGQNVSISGGVIIGDNVKIQNNVSVYEGTIIEDDVFLGPSCVLTNVTNPRSQINRKALYEKTYIKKGATIGANSTILCGISIGMYAFIGAGAVVTRDVKDYALMLGVPARQKGWMSRHGHILKHSGDDNIFVCPESKLRYKLSAQGDLNCMDIDEKESLPADLSTGYLFYDDFK